jgi:hypothetical protein
MDSVGVGKGKNGKLYIDVNAVCPASMSHAGSMCHCHSPLHICGESMRNIVVPIHIQAVLS